MAELGFELQTIQISGPCSDLPHASPHFLKGKSASSSFLESLAQVMSPEALITEINRVNSSVKCAGLLTLSQGQ